MSMQLKHILREWDKSKDALGWAMAIVYDVEGHSYRKPGAMVLVNELGEQFGLLSGGCLEKDVVRNAKKSIAQQESIRKRYDGTDDYDLSYQLGCGGIVDVLIQPVSQDNNYLALKEVLKALRERQKIEYVIEIPEGKKLGTASINIQSLDIKSTKSRLSKAEGLDCLSVIISPEPHLFIGGGGIDAQPVLNMAKSLGWLVTVWDSRPSFARMEQFKQADVILNCDYEELKVYLADKKVDAAVAMTHNLEMDANLIKVMNASKIRYGALLGPKKRSKEVLQLAGLKEEEITFPFSSPAGFNIGGELPESIALSILSECHAKLFNSELKAITLVKNDEPLTEDKIILNKK